MLAEGDEDHGFVVLMGSRVNRVITRCFPITFPGIKLCVPEKKFGETACLPVQVLPKK